MLCCLSGPISDSTMRKRGFVAPQMDRRFLLRGQDVIPMKLDESFAVLMTATAGRTTDRQGWQYIFSCFGIDVDSLQCRSDVNAPK